jgi:hypothetical protein
MLARSATQVLKPSAATKMGTRARVAACGLSSATRAFSTSRPAAQSQPKIMLEDDKGFGFIRHNTRPQKPRKVGVTEIRGPYYSAMGKNYLQDVLDT